MNSIRIVVNGEEHTVPNGLSLADLLVALGVETARVAVELDREIVPREVWRETPIAGGARLEIVQFVGGG